MPAASFCACAIRISTGNRSNNLARVFKDNQTEYTLYRDFSILSSTLSFGKYSIIELVYDFFPALLFIENYSRQRSVYLSEIRTTTHDDCIDRVYYTREIILIKGRNFQRTSNTAWKRVLRSPDYTKEYFVKTGFSNPSSITEGNFVPLRNANVSELKYLL